MPAAAPKTFPWSSLPDDMQILLADMLGSPSTLPESLPLIDIPVERFPRIDLDENDRGSAHVVAMMASMVLPPVVAEGCFVDGKHRLEACREKNVRSVSAIDLTGLGVDVAANSMGRLLPDWPQAAAEVDGRRVRKDIPNLSSISASLTNYEELPGIRAVPLALFHSAPRDLFYAADDIRQSELLAEKIRESGEVNPLIVVLDQDPRGPYILEGCHRLGALHLLGAKSFPALVIHDLDLPKPARRVAPQPSTEAGLDPVDSIILKKEVPTGFANPEVVQP